MPLLAVLGHGQGCSDGNSLETGKLTMLSEGRLVRKIRRSCPCAQISRILPFAWCPGQEYGLSRMIGHAWSSAGPTTAQISMMSEGIVHDVRSCSIQPRINPTRLALESTPCCCCAINSCSPTPALQFMPALGGEIKCQLAGCSL